jgi:hypothetical protein
LRSLEEVLVPGYKKAVEKNAEISARMHEEKKDSPLRHHTLHVIHSGATNRAGLHTSQMRNIKNMHTVGEDTLIIVEKCRSQHELIVPSSIVVVFI